MKPKPHKSVIEELKYRFRSVGCKVSDINKSSFDFSHKGFPFPTHVLLNSRYIQFSTVMGAKTKASNRSDKAIYKFLNDANVKAKLVKFTLDDSLSCSVISGRPILASAKLISGLVRSSYDGEGLKNLITLWFADIAETVESTWDIELQILADENQLSHNAR